MYYVLWIACHCGIIVQLRLSHCGMGHHPTNQPSMFVFLFVFDWSINFWRLLKVIIRIDGEGWRQPSPPFGVNLCRYIHTGKVELQYMYMLGEVPAFGPLVSFIYFLFYVEKMHVSCMLYVLTVWDCFRFSRIESISKEMAVCDRMISQSVMVSLRRMMEKCVFNKSEDDEKVCKKRYVFSGMKNN